MIPTPSPEALRYLEADLDTDTAIHGTYELGSELDVTLHSGFQTETNFQRPMFQVLVDYPNGKAAVRNTRPCPACYDFSRSWNCPDHHEPINLTSALALTEWDA